MNREYQMKDALSELLKMLVIFIGVDLLLFLLFGWSFLNGMEFTGLKMAYLDAQKNGLQQASAVMGQLPEKLFEAKDYFWNCTFFCCLEDILISLLYVGMKLHYHKIIAPAADSVYLWLTHIGIKLLLNVHSTAMFLCIMGYSRVSKWRSFLLGEADYMVPDSCFALQRNSLILALVVLLISFAIMLGYPSWKKKPWIFLALCGLDLMAFLIFSDSSEASWAILLVAFAFAVVFPLILHWTSSLRQKIGDFLKRTFKFDFKNLLVIKFGADAGKQDLYVISNFLLTGFVIVAGLWFVAGLALGKDNKNSFMGFQFSALLKLYAPIIVMLNTMLYQIQCQYPEKYRMNKANAYSFNSLITILIGCLALFAMNEFGSVVCILTLTIVMFLIQVDFMELIQNNELRARQKVGYFLRNFVVSSLIGVVVSVCVILIENTLFHFCLNAFCGKTDLGGAIGELRLNTPWLLMLGWFCLVLMVIVLLVFGLAYIRSIIARMRKRPSSFYECLMGIVVYGLNLWQGFVGKLTIPFLVKKRENQKDKTESRLSICALILVISGSVLSFNFLFHGYSDTTILRSYYMKAGNFSNEFEITENITAERAKEVATLYPSKKGDTSLETEKKPEAVPEAVRQQVIAICEEAGIESDVVNVDYIQDIQPTLSDLEAFYPTNVYHNKISLKLMRIIDRLCYSARTAELSAVQRGMKKNMGFDVENAKTHISYISSLQQKYYVTPEDAWNASDETRNIYYDGAGNLRPQFRVRTAAGEIPKSGQLGFIQYQAEVSKDVSVEFADHTVRKVTVRDMEWQRIFKSAEPVTASSDYVLFTLSRMGVGNMLLLIFIPFFFILLLLYQSNISLRITAFNATGYFRYLLHGVSILYILSFIIQAMVILMGVFGVFLFSGLSLPLVAASNCEMLLNCICCAVMLVAVGDPYAADQMEENEQ